MKYILLYSILILVLQCSGTGGCTSSGETNNKEINQYSKKAITKNELTPIEKDKKKQIKNKISKKVEPEEEPEKLLPKATYVQFTDAPKNIKNITPKYPQHELNNGIEGIVYIEFRIDTQGNVAESYIAKSSENKNLDNAALNAVLSSKWKPAKNQGKLVSVWQTLPFEFKLSN